MIIAKRAQADNGVRVNVALANLQKPSTRGQGGQSFRDGVAGQRIQHQVNALAFCESANLRGKRSGARIHDMPDTNLAKIVTLFVISRGCEYFRACQSCDLDRRQPDAAGCRVNEDFLSPLDLPQMMER